MNESLFQIGGVENIVETKNVKGIDPEKAIDQVKAATKTANGEVRLTGLDHEDNKLVGDNNEFKIESEIGEIPATKIGLAEKLLDTFDNLKRQGLIKTGTMAQRIRELSDYFTRRD